MPSEHVSRHFGWGGGLPRGYARLYAWRLLYTTYLGPSLIAHALRACSGHFRWEASQGLCTAICVAIAVHYIPWAIPHSTCPQGMPQGIFVGEASQGVMHGHMHADCPPQFFFGIKFNSHSSSEESTILFRSEVSLKITFPSGLRKLFY